jgi:uncharacterized protein YndB with AHSA1/START domain
MNSDNDAHAQAGREFVHARLIDAPPERVFEAFRDPARLARWWGPDGFSNTFDTFEFHNGGLWRLVMHGPDGSDYPNLSKFADIVAPERIVVDHLSGHHFRLTISFTAQDGRTLVGWHQLFDTAEERARIAPFVIPANEQNLARLAAEVARLPQGALDRGADDVHTDVD